MKILVVDDDICGNKNKALQYMLQTKKGKTNGNFKALYTVSKSQRSMDFFILRVFGGFSDCPKANLRRIGTEG